MKLYDVAGIEKKTGNPVYEAFFVDTEDEARSRFFEMHPQAAYEIERVAECGYDEIS
jgi:hypothetical protein